MFPTVSRVRVLMAAAAVMAAAAMSVAVLPAGAQTSGVTLVVANGWSLSDVGTAASLVAAGEGDAVVFAETATLGDATADVMTVFAPSRVVLVGGTAALTADIEEQISRLVPGVSIERFAGTDRIDTAARAARRSLGDATGGTLVLANGWSLSDVGTAASVVASGGADAVLYSGPRSLGDATTDVVTARQPARILLIGGTAALASSIEAELAQAAPEAGVVRFGGTTRIETAARSAERAFEGGASAAVIANGWSLSDVGVAASYAAARDDTAVLYAQSNTLTDATLEVLAEHEPFSVVLIGGTEALSSDIESEVSGALPSARLQRFSAATRIEVAAQAATQELNAGVDQTPGAGASVTMGRANWSTGYFQAEVYRKLLGELGYEVSNPANLELGPNNAYRVMAEGDMDFWANSWYPGHRAWHPAVFPDGSTVGDHLTVLGELMISGGVEGFLVTKSFADEHDVYTLDALNSDAAAIAAYDATDAVPGNGKADIYGCPTTWLCDDTINSQIALGGWSNIQQITVDYDEMFTAALAHVEADRPVVFYTWGPSSYIASFEPGADVYWMGMNQILDNSNPAGLPGGSVLDERGPDGTGGYADFDEDTCPSAADTENGRCPVGWLVADILVTANTDFVDANPAARALLERVKLPAAVVSRTIVAQFAGTSVGTLASRWIADNRTLVDSWLYAARTAS